VFESEIISNIKADVMDVFFFAKTEGFHEEVGRFERIQACTLTYNLK